MRIQHIMAVLIVAMLSGACSSGSGNGDNGDGSGAGDGGAHTGSLVVGGSRFVQTLDLTADTGWTRLLEYTIGNALPAVHVPASELFMGRFTLADPFHIDVHALLPFSRTAVRQTDWPGTELTVRMRGLAVSPGGQYIAAVMSDTVGTRQIEVLTDAAAGSEVVITVFRGVTGDDLVWLDDHTIAFSMDLTGVNAPGVEHLAGAVVAADLSVPLAGGPLEGIRIDVLVGFEANEWSGVDDVHSLAVTHDLQRLAYTYRGNIWLYDPNAATDPEQVTTGPHPHWGAAFSPDGSRLAFIEKWREYESHLFIVPLPTGDPHLINSAAPDGDRYHRGAVTADKVLAWLPH